MSKKWVQFQPRSNQLVEADQINSEMQAHRSSITSLDRTQMPDLSATTVNLMPAALHKCWIIPQINPSGARPGEQVNYNDATTNQDQWRCATYVQYNGGWEVLYTATLTGHRGGSIYVEWAGSGMCLGIAHMTDSATANITHQEKFLSLRIRCGGQVVAERFGVGSSIETFRIGGSILLSAGNPELSLEWKGSAPGQSDPTIDTTTNKNISQYHLFNSSVFAIGRFR